jgi:AGZA family xanthine/uracil permease-like MFS transporter
LLEHLFHLKENQTTVRRELFAGLTAFMAMAYLVVVNPRILAEAGIPGDGVLFATCLSTALATLVMGVWANNPIALPPGMSLNTYFTYAVVIGRGVRRTALGIVFLSGILFLLLTKVREPIVNDIPDCLKHGTAAGIRLQDAKLVVANPATFVTFGNLSDHEVLLAAAGVLLTAVLMARRVAGAILVSMGAVALAGIPFGLSHWPEHLFSLPH